MHDSFLVHHALINELTEAMQAAFEAEFGARGKVGFEIGVGEAVESNMTPVSPDVDLLLNPSGYNARLQEFRMARGG